MNDDTIDYRARRVATALYLAFLAVVILLIGLAGGSDIH